MKLLSKQINPYFLWDYDLTDDDILKILHGKNQTDKIWIVSRILESARFEDVWKYLTLSEVRNIFPRLKLKKSINQAWKLALSVWQ